MSGVTSACSMAKSLPVRAKPVATSSKMTSTLARHGEQNTQLTLRESVNLREYLSHWIRGALRPFEGGLPQRKKMPR